MPVCWLPYSKYRCTSTLTSWEGKGGELREKVAWPVTLVLAQGEANLLSNAGGKVGIGLGGEAFAGLGTGRCQQQAEYLRTLQSEQRVSEVTLVRRYHLISSIVFIGHGLTVY